MTVGEVIERANAQRDKWSRGTPPTQHGCTRRRQIASLLLSAAVSMSASSNVLAWGAIAVGSHGFSTITFDARTPDEAKINALEDCQKQGFPCRIDDVAINVGALVVAKGAGGVATAADVDPAKAALRALAQCNSRFSPCQIDNAEWDSGRYSGAVAFASPSEDDEGRPPCTVPGVEDLKLCWEHDAVGEKAASQWSADPFDRNSLEFDASAGVPAVVAGVSTLEEARKTAVARCAAQARPGRRCTVVASGPGSIAIVKGGGKWFVSLNAKGSAVAQADSLRRCENVTGSRCRLTATTDSPPPRAAPPAMRKLLDAARAAGVAVQHLD